MASVVLSGSMLLLLLVLLLNSNSSDSFTLLANAKNRHRYPVLAMNIADRNTNSNSDNTRLMILKQSLFAKSASCDRGFGSTPKERREIESIINEIKSLSSTVNPTKGLFPNNNNYSNDGDADVDTSEPTPTIEGSWKMVYTTALDVLTLSASPQFIVQGIYQVIKLDGNSVNVIDLAPRLQQLFPQSLIGDGTTIRLKVFTNASARSPTRIGLVFARIQSKLINLFGISTSQLPLQLNFDLPSVSLFGSNNSNKDVNAPGFFDVLYLDNDCLIISQNSPGGIFVNVRETSRPISSFFE